MKKLNYSDYMNGDVKIKEEDLQAVSDYFNKNIEMTYDEIGHIYNEAGVYLADLDVNRYEIRTRNVMINKAGGNAGENSVNYRISLPAPWMQELGIDIENREVKLTFDGEKIIIERSMEHE